MLKSLHPGAAFFSCLAMLGFALSMVSWSPPDKRSGNLQGPTEGSLPGEVLAAFAKGVYLMEKGADRAAMRYLELAWEGSSRAPYIGRKLAEVYFRVGQLARCENLVDELISGKGPLDPEFLILKAKIHYLRGDKAGAAVILERLAGHGPSSLEILRLLGKIYDELGEDEKAVHAYGKALRLDSPSPYVLYRYGALLRKFQRTDEAAKALSRALSLEPRFVDPAIDLAEILIEKGNPARAESLLTAFVEHEPGNDRILVLLSRLYLDQGKLDNGIRMLESRKRRGPLSVDALILLGRFYYEAKEYGEALSIFQALYNEEERSPELARVLGEISLKAGYPKQSAGYFREAIELDPENYRNYLSLFFAASPKFAKGVKLRVSLTGEEIVNLLSSAGELVPENDSDGCYLLGISYQSLDSLEMARGYLLKAYRLKPKDEGTLFALASIEEKSKRYEAAERYLKKLYALDPDDASVCNFYGYLLAEVGKDLDKAEELVRKALRTEPSNGYYIDSLGWVFYQRGDYHEAIIELEKASRLVEDDPVILEHLGDAYKALKRYRKALAAYEKSRELQGGNEGLLEKIESAKKGIE